MRLSITLALRISGKLQLLLHLPTYADDTRGRARSSSGQSAENTRTVQPSFSAYLETRRKQQTQEQGRAGARHITEATLSTAHGVRTRVKQSGKGEATGSEGDEQLSWKCDAKQRSLKIRCINTLLFHTHSQTLQLQK